MKRKEAMLHSMRAEIHQAQTTNFVHGVGRLWYEGRTSDTRQKWVVGSRWGHGEPWESLGHSCSRTRSPIVIGDLVGFPEGRDAHNSHKLV